MTAWLSTARAERPEKPASPLGRGPVSRGNVRRRGAAPWNHRSPPVALPIHLPRKKRARSRTRQALAGCDRDHRAAHQTIGPTVAGHRAGSGRRPRLRDPDRVRRSYSTRRRARLLAGGNRSCRLQNRDFRLNHPSAGRPGSAATPAPASRRPGAHPQRLQADETALPEVAHRLRLDPVRSARPQRP